MRFSVPLLMAAFFVAPVAKAEFRSAKDMQKECRVALQVMNGTAEKSFENVLFTGECIGYIQGAIDASQPLAENTTWYKVCVPDNVSTDDLIRRFILRVALESLTFCTNNAQPASFELQWTLGCIWDSHRQTLLGDQTGR